VQLQQTRAVANRRAQKVVLKDEHDSARDHLDWLATVPVIDGHDDLAAQASPTGNSHSGLECQALDLHQRSGTERI
jgi:hypothetical protein